LYVTNQNGNFVTVITINPMNSPPTVVSVKTIPVGDTPQGVAVSLVGPPRVYVANSGSGSVSVIEAINDTKVNFNTPSTDIEVGGSPFGVAVHPDRNTIYATDGFGKSVFVLEFTKPLPDPPTKTSETVGNNPRGVAVTPDGALVYVANVSDDSVSVINAANSKRFVFTSADANAKGDLKVGSAPVALGQFIGFPVLDKDGDGIQDLVDGLIDGMGKFVDKSNDPANKTFTNKHLCGTVSGEILSGTAAIDSFASLVATAGPAGAEIELCDFKTVVLSGGQVKPLSCGSLIAEVVVGPFQILLDTSGTATVPSGVTVRVARLAEGQFEVQNLGGDGTILVEFQGQVREVRPGESVTVSQDTTPPTTTATPSPAPNANGWNNSNVAVTLTASDDPDGTGVLSIGFSLSGAQAGEGLVTASSTSVTISAEGTTTLTYFARDNAGNQEAAKSLTIRIDKTPPVVTAGRTPAPNAFGWNNTDVTARFEATDSLSGIQGASLRQIAFAQEGANQSAMHTFTDLAGNSTSATVSGINIDKSPPIIAAARTPEPNANGWNNTDVTVNFTASDALSGVDTVSGPVILTVEGIGQEASGAATDRAGNSASLTVTVNIDKTAPELAARCAPPGRRPFLAGRDSLSGVASVAPTGSTPVHRGKFKARETYTILDRAGNSLEAVFGLKAEGHEVEFSLLSLAYNGSPRHAVSDNELKCEWAMDRSGRLKELEQKLELERHGTEVHAKFDARKNETTIRVKTRGSEHHQRFTRPGLVFLNLTTNGGRLGFDF
jgi:YVTN family beta-propeller protein